MAAALSADGKRLEDQEWYHGHRSRKDAMTLVIDPGDFLVRATDSGPSADIVVTCCDETRKISNLTLRKNPDNGQWYILPKQGKPPKYKFATPVELIEHYRAKPPSKQLKLARAIPRPEWVVPGGYVYYEEKDRIGWGGNGIVYKGLMAKKTGNLTVAVKIPLRATAEKETDSEEVKKDRAAMQREAQTLAHMAHANIVQFYGVATDQPPIHIITEYCPGGDLLSHLAKSGKATDEREKLVYLFEASRGLIYLHAKKITHGNLAARNCLISRHGIVKIGDYGPKFIDEGAQAPVRWSAPECLPAAPPVYSSGTDVWAFSILMYEVFSNGATPSLDLPAKDVAGRIKENKVPALPVIWPAGVVDLLKRVWTAQPEQRPTMKVISQEFNEMLTWIVKFDGQFPVDKMTVNGLPGVNRTVYYEQIDFADQEDSGGEKTVKETRKKKK